MSYQPLTDFALEVQLGNVAGIAGVTKFGRNSFLAAATPADIWTGPTGIWVAPTTARTHDIVSTSASDDGAPVGVGARTLRVFGLTGWGTAEVFEDITLNGVTNVPTANAYVIIHRMQVLTYGATGVNVGVITATAQTDATVTASIGAGAATGTGQTKMAIYGVPSTQTAYITKLEASIGTVDPAANMLITLCVTPDPTANLLHCIQKHQFTLLGAGSSEATHPFNPYQAIPGPAIIRMQAQADVVSNVDAGFDLYLVDN